MRVMLCVFYMFLLISAALWSADMDMDIEIDLQSAADGDWQLRSGRLVQRDVDAGKAKFAIPYSQNGNAVYEFNVKYERGVLDDGHGGFGLHVFADSVLDGEAWGAGESWLLWLNYDESPSTVIPGLSAQIYQSISHSQMELQEEYDLNYVVDLFARAGMTAREVLANPVPVKIVINGDSGEVRVYDPTVERYYYVFTLPLEGPMEGDYVALRTNGVSLSFGM